MFRIGKGLCVCVCGERERERERERDGNEMILKGDNPYALMNDLFID